MREIPEKKLLPEDKDEIIRFLNERLDNAEDAITDAQTLLKKEREVILFQYLVRFFVKRIEKLLQLN